MVERKSLKAKTLRLFLAQINLNNFNKYMNFQNGNFLVVKIENNDHLSSFSFKRALILLVKISI